MKKMWLVGLAALTLLTLGVYKLYPDWFAPVRLGDVRYLMGKVERNYGYQVDSLCQKYRLPPEYFKALILLECGANKPANSRFEAKVYQTLLQVRDGQLAGYSGVTTAQLRGRADAELRLLATSWGPLQIMGYHCLGMGLTVDDLRGPHAVRHGILWSKNLYGRYLREYRLRDAFHFHNRGRPFPKFGGAQTHDPSYVNKGLAYAQILR
jgi:hypothetical protein